MDAGIAVKVGQFGLGLQVEGSVSWIAYRLT